MSDIDTQNIRERFEYEFGRVKLLVGKPEEGMEGAYIHIEGRDYYVIEGNDAILAFISQLLEEKDKEWLGAIVRMGLNYATGDDSTLTRKFNEFAEQRNRLQQGEKHT